VSSPGAQGWLSTERIFRLDVELDIFVQSLGEDTMPQATFFPKRSPKDFKSALDALARMWFADELQLSDEEVEACRQVVWSFIRRAGQSAPAGGETDA